MRMRRLAGLAALSGAAALLPGFSAAAQEAPTLLIGDTAPAIPGSAEWIQGEPVERLDDGRVYAIDFWATWCGPCIASIPEVQALHEDLRDEGVVVIGAHIWASAQAPEPEELLREQGASMTYPIVKDTDGALAAAFMEAAGRRGIPTMMIIGRDGRLAWMGHPQGGARRVAEEVAAGTFDIAGAREAATRERKAEAVAQQANALALEGDWEAALREIDRAVEMNPAGQRKLAVVKVQRLALTLDREEEAYAYARTLLDDVIAGDAYLLNNLARFLVEAPRLAPRDYDLARDAALRALELTNDAFPDAMATLATVEFESGRVEQAVETQRRALALAQAAESPLVREYELKLEEYERAWSEVKPTPY